MCRFNHRDVVYRNRIKEAYSRRTKETSESQPNEHVLTSLWDKVEKVGGAVVTGTKKAAKKVGDVAMEGTNEVATRVGGTVSAIAEIPLNIAVDTGVAVTNTIGSACKNIKEGIDEISEDGKTTTQKAGDLGKTAGKVIADSAISVVDGVKDVMTDGFLGTIKGASSLIFSKRETEIVEKDRKEALGTSILESPDGQAGGYKPAVAKNPAKVQDKVKTGIRDGVTGGIESAKSFGMHVMSKETSLTSNQEKNEEVATSVNSTEVATQQATQTSTETSTADTASSPTDSTSSPEANEETNLKRNKALLSATDSLFFDRTEKVKEMLQDGDIDVNYRENDEKRTPTPLMNAIKRGRDKMALALLEKEGIDINGLIDEDGNTAFLLACKYGREDVLKKILDSKQIKNVDSLDKFNLYAENASNLLENVKDQTTRENMQAMLQEYRDKIKLPVDIELKPGQSYEYNHEDETYVVKSKDGSKVTTYVKGEDNQGKMISEVERKYTDDGKQLLEQKTTEITEEGKIVTTVGYENGGEKFSITEKFDSNNKPTIKEYKGVLPGSVTALNSGHFTEGTSGCTEEYKDGQLFKITLSNKNNEVIECDGKGQPVKLEGTNEGKKYEYTFKEDKTINSVTGYNTDNTVNYKLEGTFDSACNFTTGTQTEYTYHKNSKKSNETITTLNEGIPTSRTTNNYKEDGEALISSKTVGFDEKGQKTETERQYEVVTDEQGHPLRTNDNILVHSITFQIETKYDKNDKVTSKTYIGTLPETVQYLNGILDINPNDIENIEEIYDGEEKASKIKILYNDGVEQTYDLTWEGGKISSYQSKYEDETTDTFILDKNGKLTSRMIIDLKDKKTMFISFKYDDKGTTIIEEQQEETEYYEGGREKQKTIEHIKVDGDKRTTTKKSIIEKKYLNDGGRKETTTEYAEDGTTIQNKTIETYNNKGNVILQELFDGDVKYQEISTTYQDDGETKVSTHYTHYKEGETRLSETIIQYKQNGEKEDFKCVISYKEDGKTKDTELTIKYLEDGGREETEIQYDDEENVSSTVISKYNKDGNLQTKEYEGVLPESVTGIQENSFVEFYGINSCKEEYQNGKLLKITAKGGITIINYENDKPVESILTGFDDEHTEKWTFNTDMQMNSWTVYDKEGRTKFIEEGTFENEKLGLLNGIQTKYTYSDDGSYTITGYKVTDGKSIELGSLPYTKDKKVDIDKLKNASQQSFTDKDKDIFRSQFNDNHWMRVIDRGLLTLRNAKGQPFEAFNIYSLACIEKDEHWKNVENRELLKLVDQKGNPLSGEDIKNLSEMEADEFVQYCKKNNIHKK